ncbi:MAG TPA: hypothetical protein VMF31_00845 [Solirubrobacterales bacterium]|nr:hypothetical protein [Solirubrobacterales bacterium]
MKKLKHHLSPALLISVLALFVALGGGAYAALGANSVGSKQLKKNAVTAKKIKKNAVVSSKIKNLAVTTPKVANNAINGAKVDESTLGPVPNAVIAEQAVTAATIDGYFRLPQKKVTASNGPANYQDAADASAEIPLFSQGPISIYGKCFTQLGGDTNVVLYAKTTQNGAILDSDNDDLDGDPLFLDTDTPENERELQYDYTSANSSSFYGIHSTESVVEAPDGTSIEVRIPIAVKQGDLPGGNGIYGDGDVCLFSGDMTVFGG